MPRVVDGWVVTPAYQRYQPLTPLSRAQLTNPVRLFGLLYFDRKCTAIDHHTHVAVGLVGSAGALFSLQGNRMPLEGVPESDLAQVSSTDKKRGGHRISGKESGILVTCAVDSCDHECSPPPPSRVDAQISLRRPRCAMLT